MTDYLLKINKHLGAWVYQNVVNAVGSNIEVKKEFTLEELHIYGSSRHGIHKPNVTLVNKTYKLNNIDSATDSSMAVLNYKYFKRTLTYKQYELTNHLGNILATVLDRKTFVGDDTLEYYQADVYTAGLYYAFGSSITEMQYSSDTSNKYRYGFNGMEKDPESFNDAYDFGARIYDGRLGRWLSLDPLMKKYPDVSPFCGIGNNPIILVDKDGKDPVLIITNEITGYTIQRVYGDGTGVMKSHVIVVPTYKAILCEIDLHGTQETILIQSFNVTRDAWYFRGTLNNENQLLNRAFEPGENEEFVAYKTQRQESYPNGDLIGYRLTNFENSIKLPAIPFSQNSNVDGSPLLDARKENNIATGVMFHIGGYYSYDVGEFGPLDIFPFNFERLAASNGCFGYIPSDDVYSDICSAENALMSGNKYNDNLSNDSYGEVCEMIDWLTNINNSSFYIVVQKRDDYCKEQSSDSQQWIGTDSEVESENPVCK